MSATASSADSDFIFLSTIASGRLPGILAESQIIRAAECAEDAGATIIASKDIHPSDHCSFAGEDMLD